MFHRRVISFSRTPAPLNPLNAYDPTNSFGDYPQQLRPGSCVFPEIFLSGVGGNPAEYAR